MILNPLQRVEVVESRKKCKPGSIGYFVSQDPVNSYNGWDMCIVFTRFGKKGVPRVDPFIVSPRMIEYTTMKSSDKEIMETVGVRERVDSRSGRIGDCVIKPIPMDSKNLLDLSENEFTAYIISLSLFLYKMTYRSYVKTLDRIPILKDIQGFVVGRFNLLEAPAEYLGYYIIFCRNYADTSPQRQSFDLAYAKQISTPERKKLILRKLHKALSMTKTSLDVYNRSREGYLSNVHQRINEVIKYYRRNKSSLKDLKDKDLKEKKYRRDYIRMRGHDDVLRERDRDRQRGLR